MTTTSRRFGDAVRHVRVGVRLGLAALLVFGLAAARAAEGDPFQFNATVRGTVVDSDGNPLEGVTVTIRKQVQDPTRLFDPIELTTDEDGNFNARNVPIGATIVIFEYEGYEVHEETRRLRAGPVRLNVTMQPVVAPEEFVQAEAAVALDRDDAATQYNIGVTMVGAGDVAGGIAHIERALELQPEYPLALQNIGYAYARVEAYAKAVEAFDRYVEQAPDAEDVPQIKEFIAALKELIGG